ncbi:MAG: transglutaminase family protein [Pseudomonadota bacterium]
MLLSIRHETTYRYDPAARDLALRLRLYAYDTVQQRVLDWAVSVNGERVAPLLRTALGNGEGMWFARRSGEQVSIVAEGTVETSDQAGVLGRMGSFRPGIYLRHTPLTEPGEAVHALSETVSGDDPLGRMHALNAAVHGALDYKAGVTDATTTAEQAAALGGGVCQDFAHLFVACARHLGVPARYVVGYVHVPDAPEHESHAWAEAYLEGLGWVGFDPVHEVCPALDHLRLLTGFDAADAAPLRGTMLPGSEEEIDVEVTIKTGGQSQSQSQD